MLGARINVGKKSKDEAEKPFWISFADLMTALMVLFLLVMSVALLAVTKTMSEQEIRQKHRSEAITAINKRISSLIKNYPGVTYDSDRNVIDFGERARFDYKSSNLNELQSVELRKFVSDVVLNVMQMEAAEEWLKRIVVEGFTDKRGTYLYNLNLSLERSQRVICALLTDSNNNASNLSQSAKEQVRDLFFVGGYSFNSAKSNDDESRRIELRLEFYGLDEGKQSKSLQLSDSFGVCGI
jgi:outer membrane protein OmpA-like peptidoglycan-associated protein